METVNKAVVPAWIVAVLSSFAVSIDLGVAACVGLVGQWLGKAPAGVPTWAAQLGMIAAVAAGYYLLHLHGPFDHAYFVQMAVFGLSSLGIASATAATGGAPHTNSIK